MSRPKQDSSAIRFLKEEVGFLSNQIRSFKSYKLRTTSIGINAKYIDVCIIALEKQKKRLSKILYSIQTSRVTINSDKGVYGKLGRDEDLHLDFFLPNKKFYVVGMPDNFFSCRAFNLSTTLMVLKAKTDKGWLVIPAPQLQVNHYAPKDRVPREDLSHLRLYMGNDFLLKHADFIH